MSLETIDRVRDFKDEVLSSISNRDIISFRLGDINIENKTIYVNDMVLTKPAMNRVLSAIRVREDFIKYKDQINDDEWIQIENVLKNANKDTEFWGKRVLNETKGDSTITKLFQKNEVALKNNYNMAFGNYFDLILMALEGTQKDFETSLLDFNNDSEIVTMRFIDKSSDIDVLKDMSDMWKQGCNITFDLLQYSSAPFFERQICTNGMVAQQHGFKTNIRNKSFNEVNIQKDLNKLLIKGDERYNDMILNSVNHLKQNTISIREFHEYKDFFESRNGTSGRYDHIIGKAFNEDAMYRTYGVNIAEQTSKWKSTASSGRNAYDFFNDLTWMASHPVQTRIDDNDAKELQIKVSNLFFKEQLDLEDIAPSVNLSIGKIYTHNN